ncbi:MAG: type II secretion system protein GspM [Hyphomonadaceae bacterium]
MEQLNAWLAQRTARERLLLGGAAILVFAILLPLWAYQGAVSYNRDARNDLEAARAVEADVARITAAARAAPIAADDAGARGAALASARALDLRIGRIEARGGDAIAIVFEPADSLRIYRWIDAMARRGAFVRRTHITRIDETNVAAEFEAADGP